MLRLLEIENSIKLIEQSLQQFKQTCVGEKLAPTENHIDKEQPLPKGVVSVHLEAPEGEVAVTVCSNGQKEPCRVRIKTPSFMLSAALSSILSGSQLDEVVLLLSTLGINTLHNDR